jgi:hypothetical protein
MVLDLYSVRSQLFNDTVQTVLVDRAQSFRRQLQGDPFVFFGKEKTLGLQIGQKPAIGLDIRMRHLMPGDRNLTRYLTNSSHDVKFWIANVGKDWQLAKKDPSIFQMSEFYPHRAILPSKKFI